MAHERMILQELKRVARIIIIIEALLEHTQALHQGIAEQLQSESAVEGDHVPAHGELRC
jgi:hypothetical protein